MNTNVALARSCIASIEAGRSCAIGRDRNRTMAGQPSCGGKSIIEMLWDRLLECYHQLVLAKESQIHDDMDRSEVAHEISSARGECLGLGTALAIMMNPYRPDVDAIRAECVERYEARKR